MKQIPVQIDGFENQTIEVHYPGILSDRQLLVNGKPAAKGEKRGEMRLTRDDGREVMARWKNSLRREGLEVDGTLYHFGRTLAWYELLLILAPVILPALGLAGWVFAGVAVVLGFAIFRSPRPFWQKFFLWFIQVGIIILLSQVVGSLLLAWIR